jgi:predicted  nucleic acid-binding Zn-ribbon protein
LNPHLAPLLELQALDLRIQEITDQHRKTPVLLETAEAPLREAQQQLKTVTASLEALTKERRDRERDLDVHETQADKLRARLTELKTNKEYQAHLFEIEMANKKKADIEDHILSLMERIEQQQQAAAEAKARAADAERAFQDEKRRLEIQAAALREELTGLEHKRAELTVGIEPTLLARYNKLKGTRKDAIAPVRNGICFGCRLQLPPQLVAEVKRSDALLSCSYCHRLLYWEGEPVSVPATPRRDTAKVEEEEEPV